MARFISSNNTVFYESSAGTAGVLCASFFAAILAVAPLSAASSDLELPRAAEQRDVTAVRTLLAAGADVNATQPDGATALHWAAHWDDVTLAELLTDAGANPNATNDYGVTPLFLAASNGSARMTEVLLAAGAEPGASLPSGETALMTAVRGGNVDVVTDLLAAGADPDAAQVSKGQTALMWAATAQRVEVARALIDGGANVHATTASGFTPLLFAAREGGIDMAQVLLGSGADVNERADDGSTPVLVATVRGHAALAMFLLDQGGDPNGDMEAAGYGPLHWAVARFDHFTANPSARDEWKALFGIPDHEAKHALINALLVHGADVNAITTRAMPASFGDGFNGATPFIIATGSGDPDAMRLLLDHGADPTLRRRGGGTAIMAACSGNADTSIIITEQARIDAIELAMTAGVDIEAADEKGYRAMHHAAASGFHRIIELLLAHGADLNPITKTRVEKDFGVGDIVVEGQTPLGIVEGTFTGGIIRERPATAEFLRDLGAKSVGKATLEKYIGSGEESTRTATGAER